MSLDNAWVDVIVQVDDRQQVVGAGGGIHLALVDVIRDIGGDVLGLAQFAFDLGDEG